MKRPAGGRWRIVKTPLWVFWSEWPNSQVMNRRRFLQLLLQPHWWLLLLKMQTCYFGWFVVISGWFIDKKLFTNKTKLLILFVVMKKLCPELLVTLNKNKSAYYVH